MSSNQPQGFPEWIADNLALRGWTQTDLARESGISRQAISYYMSDKSKYPTIEGVLAICRAFKVPLSAALSALGLSATDEKQKGISRAAANLLNEMDAEDQEDAIRYLRFKLEEGKRKKHRKPK